MTDREFWNMMIDERIKCLLPRKLTKEESEILEEGDRIIEELPEEKREKVLQFLNTTAEMESENETNLYIGGVCDGIRLKTWMAKVEEGHRKFRENNARN